MTYLAAPAVIRPAGPPLARARDPRSGQSAVARQAADHERRRLARELHDNVIQQLFATCLTIDWCLAELPAESPVHAKLEQAQRLSRAASRQLRSSLQALRDGSAADEEDLPVMLRRLLTRSAAQDLDLRVHVTGAPVLLAAAVSRSLYAIASECLFNAVTHARARRAVVGLGYGRDTLALLIADDGHGDPETLRKIIHGEVPGAGGGYHVGLADIASRTEELGGTLTIARSNLGGIAVKVRLPVGQLGDPAGGDHE